MLNTNIKLKIRFLFYKTLLFCFDTRFIYSHHHFYYIINTTATADNKKPHKFGIIFVVPNYVEDAFQIFCCGSTL